MLTAAELLREIEDRQRNQSIEIFRDAIAAFLRKYHAPMYVRLTAADRRKLANALLRSLE